MEVDVSVVRGVAARLEGDVAENLRKNCEDVHKILELILAMAKDDSCMTSTKKLGFFLDSLPIV